MPQPIMSNTAVHAHAIMATIYLSSNGYFQHGMNMTMSSVYCVYCITRFLSNRAPLGMRDLQHECAADKRAASDAIMSTLNSISEEYFQRLAESMQ